MFRYVIKRLLQMLPLLVIISFIAFGIIVMAEIIAGADPLAKLKQNPSVTKERIAEEKLRMGYETARKEDVKIPEALYPAKFAHKGKIATETITIYYATDKITDKAAFSKAVESEIKSAEEVDGLIAKINGGESLQVALKSVVKDDAKVSSLLVQVKKLNKLKFIAPQVDFDGANNKGQANFFALAQAKAAAKIKLKSGEFSFANNQFYFNSSDVGRSIKLAYSTPNGFVFRYYSWATKFLSGDMGDSFAYNTAVSKLILGRLGNTVILGLATLIVTWLIAIPLGVFLAVRQYSFIDQLFSSVSYFFMGFPDFFLAILFLLLAASTGWFPTSGKMSIEASQSGSLMLQIGSVLHHLILPTLTLSLISIASLQRRMRANLLDILGEEYIKTARAKGLSENKVIYKHALRNAINPIITLLGFEVAGLLSGAAFVEIIFSWPGLGNMMLAAILGSDMNLVMAGLVISSFMLLLGNLFADLLLAAVDPRIKLEA